MNIVLKFPRLPEGPKMEFATFPGDGSGCRRAQTKHFFGMQEGSRTVYGLGLMVGGRLHRLRMRFGQPMALKSSGSKPLANHT